MFPPQVVFIFIESRVLRRKYSLVFYKTLRKVSCWYVSDFSFCKDSNTLFSLLLLSISRFEQITKVETWAIPVSEPCSWRLMKMILSYVLFITQQFSELFSLHSAWFWVGLSSRNDPPQQAIRRWPSSSSVRAEDSTLNKCNCTPGLAINNRLRIGLSPNRVHSVNTALLPLIPINIVSSKGQL